MSHAWTDPLVGDEEPDPLAVALMSAGTAELDLAQLFARPAWYALAACRGAGTDAFYGERGQSTAQAKALCEGCEVVDACRSAGRGEVFGIWGGTAPRERRAIRSSGRLKVPRRT